MEIFSLSIPLFISLAAAPCSPTTSKLHMFETAFYRNNPKINMPVLVTSLSARLTTTLLVIPTLLIPLLYATTQHSYTCFGCSLWFSLSITDLKC